MATAKHPRASPRARSRWRVGTASSPERRRVSRRGDVPARRPASCAARGARRRRRRRAPTTTTSRAFPPERPTPPAETRANDASARDDAGEPSTSVSSSSAAAVCPRLGRGGVLRRPSARPRVSFLFRRGGRGVGVGLEVGRVAVGDGQMPGVTVWLFRDAEVGPRRMPAAVATSQRQQQRCGSEKTWCAIRSSARRARRWRTFYRSGSARAPPTASPDTSARGGRCSPTPSWRKRGPRTSSPRISSRVLSSPSSSHMGRARDSRRKRSPPRYSKTREVVHQRALRRSHHVAGQSRRRLGRGCARAPRRSHGSDHTRT